MAQVCGLELVEMPDDISPIAALVVLKAFDAEGDVAYYARATEGVTTVEALGMVVLADVRLRSAINTDTAEDD